ncbi:hypothetical protein SAMN03080617_03550 [Algoriphagus alkaliphilus]|uniref:Uncharacterized protein n=1 Tax=Algoriphagus alkaliphilus TaxID=279824 RepID=A0A1G5ZCT2_9BACT|nr:hypothetical protein SAMN03080617_03550 [Algoriphagus alkaliphilus]
MSNSDIFNYPSLFSSTAQSRLPRLGVQISPFFLPQQYQTLKKIAQLHKSLEMIKKNIQQIKKP